MENLSISYTPQFLKDISNPNNIIKIFYFKLVSANKLINNNPISIVTDKLNEDVYVVELDENSIGVTVSPDGIIFSHFDTLCLYYLLNDNITYRLAASIPINQKGNSILYDYCYNYIYIDISKLGCVAKLVFDKVRVPGRSSTDEKVYGTLLNHKHETLIQEFNNQSTTNNTFSSDCVIDYILNHNSGSYVRYYNKSFDTNHLVSSDNNFINSNDSEFIDKSMEPKSTYLENDTKDVYQFKNGFITILGIELNDEVNQSIYEILSQDALVYMYSDKELSYYFDRSSIKFTTSITSVDFTITVDSINEFNLFITTTSPFIKISEPTIEDNKFTYKLTLTDDVPDMNLDGIINCLIRDNSGEYNESIPWSYNMED